MAFMMLGIGFALLPLLLRLALRLRLGIPLLYSVLMLTVFHGWYQAHAALDDKALLALHCPQIVCGDFLNPVIAHAHSLSVFALFLTQDRWRETPCRSHGDARAYGPFPPRGHSR